MPVPRTPPRRGAAAALALAALALAALALAALALAGCAATGSSPPTDASADATPYVEVSGDPTTWPLTGLPAQPGEAVRDHPVLVAKIDNTSGAAPQVGLGAADLVVEEMVEGGVTRLAAFYYSELPDRVGPVRSMRASDIGIVSPVGASVVTSGAAAVTIRRIQDAGITYYEEETDEGFSRDPGRPAPYNLFADLTAVGPTGAGVPARPVDYLPFGSGGLAGAPRAATLDARFSTGHTTSWTYEDGHYVDADSLAAEGDEFAADSVLALEVQVGDAGYRDPAGNPVPETTLVGGGQAWLVHGGRVVRATWSKSALDAPLVLSAATGPVAVPPGRTWIELVPADGGAVTVGR